MTSLSELESSLVEAKSDLDQVNTKLLKISGREENYRRNLDSNKASPLRRRISSTDTGAIGWDRNPVKRSRDQVFRREDESKEKRMKQFKSTKEPRNAHKLQDSDILKVSEKPQRPNTDDEVTIQRNRRLFGNIMSTLKQFQMTEVRNSTSNKEQRRREIAHKLEREEQQDRESAANEKRDLVESKQDVQMHISCIQEKIEVEKMNTIWDEHYEKLSNFIRTKTSPHIFYLPKRHNKRTRRLLENTKKKLNAHNASRRKKFDDAIGSKYSIGGKITKSAQSKSKSNSSKHNPKHS